MLKLLMKMLFPAHTEAHYRTVRYAFPLVVITALFAGLASVISDNSSFVTLRTTTDTVSENDTFYIDVLVTAHIPVNAVDLVISYPEDTMRVESIDTGTSVITLWTEEPYAKKGNIYIRGGTFRKGFLGEHTIARIKATAIADGVAKVLLQDTHLIAGDGLGTDVDVVEGKYNEVRVVVGSADGNLTGEARISVVSDTDGDGDVDLKDISTFMVAWFTRGNLFDFNGDGRMTFTDFSIILAESFFR